MLDAKNEAHAHYEVIRARGCPSCARARPSRPTSSRASSAAASTTRRSTARSPRSPLRADGLFLYAHLLAEHLESAGGEIDFGKLDALPAGLGEVYATNFRRAFPGGADDDGCGGARPLVELVAAAPEPLKVETAKAMLGMGSDSRVFELTSLVLPVRDGLIHVLHKTVRRRVRRVEGRGL